MANKIITGLLIVLVVLMGGTAYYSYTLSQQIDDLGKNLAGFELEQTARIDAVRSELAEFRMETSASIDTLKENITENLADISALEEETGNLQAQLSSLENELKGISSRVDTLDEGLADAVARLSHSMIDASVVYDRVSQATVRIGNGQTTFGSGFIFDNDSHVLTNFHVVNGLSPIYVTLYDGRVSGATTIGYSEYSDIAVLELDDNPGIEPPPLADSSQVAIGEPVVAIGSPFGLRDTLTVGTLSQINRFADVPNMLQFDAAVNPGNSGGPLADANGEIIGVVTARIPPNEGDGICYAVSSNKAKRVASAIIAFGYFDYPWIGVDVIDVTPQMAGDLLLPTANGALVAGVATGSPAETAGIEANDVIIALDGLMIKDTDGLISYLGEFKSPGDTSIVSLIRGSIERELSVEIGRRP